MPEDSRRDLAMHVAALAPQFANREAVSAKALADEREIARAKAVAAGKPEAVADKMVEGMIGKWYGEVVLLDQAFAKDDREEGLPGHRRARRARTRPSSASSASRWARASRRRGGDFAAEVAALTK